MQMNPHMTGMPMQAGMAPASMAMMQHQMGHPQQQPMMAYQQQPQQYMQYQQQQPMPPPHQMPGMMMQPPQQMPTPMDIQYVMHQQPQMPPQQQQHQLQHHQQHQQQQQLHHKQASSGGSGGGGGGGGSQNPKGRVFIGNLNTADIGRPELERIFSPYGQLTEVNVHNGFAFVQFVDEASARAACQREDRKLYGGQTVDVNIASEPKNRRDRHGPPPAGGAGSTSSAASSVTGSGGGGGLSVKDRLGPRRVPPPLTGQSVEPLDYRGAGGLAAASRDYLVCGNCRDAFDSAERLTAHKQDGCRRRFVCRCKRPAGEPRALDCAKCGRQFPSSWELLRHCQSEHEISVYANCVYASSGGSAAAAAAANAAGATAASATGGGNASLSSIAAGSAASVSAASSTAGDEAGGNNNSGDGDGGAKSASDAAAAVDASSMDAPAASAADAGAAAAGDDSTPTTTTTTRRRGEEEDDDDDDDDEATEEEDDSEKDDE